MSFINAAAAASFSKDYDDFFVYFSRPFIVHKEPIKVMCLSPSAVDTDMARSLTEYRVKDEDYQNYNWDSSICWARPQEIASIVRWMIEQPEWINIPEMVVDNHYSKSFIW